MTSVAEALAACEADGKCYGAQFHNGWDVSSDGTGNNGHWRFCHSQPAVQDVDQGAFSYSAYNRICDREDEADSDSDSTTASGGGGTTTYGVGVSELANTTPAPAVSVSQLATVDTGASTAGGTTLRGVWSVCVCLGA